MKLPAGTPLVVGLRFRVGHRVAVGRMAMDRGEAILEYDPAFIASGVALNPLANPPGQEPLAPKDPRVFEGLPGIFGDSLPDAWGELLIQRRAQRAGISHSSLTALDKLGIVGERGRGALVYAPRARRPPCEGRHRPRRHRARIDRDTRRSSERHHPAPRTVSGIVRVVRDRKS